MCLLISRSLLIKQRGEQAAVLSHRTCRPFTDVTDALSLCPVRRRALLWHAARRSWPFRDNSSQGARCCSCVVMNIVRNTVSSGTTGALWGACLYLWLLIYKIKLALWFVKITNFLPMWNLIFCDPAYYCALPSEFTVHLSPSVGSQSWVAISFMGQMLNAEISTILMFMSLFSRCLKTDWGGGQSADIEVKL